MIKEHLQRIIEAIKWIFSPDKIEYDNYDNPEYW